jgi:hypothetical protein
MPPFATVLLVFDLGCGSWEDMLTASDESDELCVCHGASCQWV